MSKKYEVTNLTKKCTQFMEKNLTIDTAVQLLDKMLPFKDQDSKSILLRMIKEQAPETLASEEFPKLSKKALHEILLLELNVSKEIEVFKASLAWAQHHCQKLQKSVNGANMRDVLGDNLYLIRFPTMSVDDINEVVLPQGILTAREGLQVLQYLTAKTNKPRKLIFPTKLRGDAGCTCRSLIMPHQYFDSDLIGVPDLKTLPMSTNISCFLSKRVMLKRISIFVTIRRYLRQRVSVSLTQYEKKLFSRHFDVNRDRGNTAHSCGMTVMYLWKPGLHIWRLRSLFIIHALTSWHFPCKFQQKDLQEFPMTTF